MVRELYLVRQFMPSANIGWPVRRDAVWPCWTPEPGSITSNVVRSYDVLIVGGGTAGATAAWKCAHAGLRTLLVDRRERGKTGASWVNGVECRLFEELGLGPPEPPVLFHQADAFHMQSPGGQRVTCRDIPTYEIEMGALNDLLLDRAEAAGALLEFGRSLLEVTLEQGRVVGATFGDNTTKERVRAAVTVDASGMTGVVRSRLPKEAWHPEAIPDDSICVANQQVRELTDRRAAQDFLEAHGMEPGDNLCWSGVRGGYSILNVGIDLERDQISFLTGGMQWSQGGQVAVQLIDEGAKRLGFVGRRISGGGGLIPVRRAFDRIVGDGYALIGNAASQVFPAHGSGVAAGMRAADILARTLSQAIAHSDVGTAALWPYAREYQADRGALCAAHEFVRRLSETFEPADMDVMFASGMIDGEAATRSLGCLPLRLSAVQLAGTTRGVLRSPRLVGRVLRTAAWTGLAQAHYARYPREWSERRFERWSRRTQRLFGV